jgi:two-component system phosphate regulon response regulator PhoB
MARILVVEDEADLRQVLEFNLTGAGHEVQTVGSGEAGLRKARERRPDLVLLDLMLPDMSGLEVCRQFKTDETLRVVPIIMLTARGDEIDRVVGFEVGADDYVAKPFSVRELTLRIGAVLRRKDSPPAESDANVFGRLRLDRQAHRAWVDGEELDLTALEFKLLSILHERRDRVQSRSVLLDVVWGIRADVTTRTVDTHVKRLREKLGAARDYVETVRGVGYRFLGAPPEGD